MKIVSSEAIAALEAVIKRLGTDYSIEQLKVQCNAKTLPIAMAIEVGHFLIERDFFGNVDAYDGTGAIDEFIFDFFKTLTEDTQLADDAVYAFNKSINDAPSISHTEVFDFYKSLANTAEITDTYISHLEKPLTDDASITDVQTQLLDKVTTDSTVTADSEYIEFYKSLLSDSVLADDIDKLDVFKNTQSEAGFTDVETLVFAKFITDGIGVTDDIDGEASVLDDQEMQYFKFILSNNIANVSDQFVRVVSYIREYSDTAQTTDDEVFHVGKGILEDNVVTDDIDKVEFGKDAKDTADITDSIDKFDFGKDSVDETGFTDDSTIDSAKSLLDTSSELTDEHSTLVAKLLVNTADLTDQQAYDLTKELGENIASTIDDEYRSFNKARNSASAVTDTIDTLAFFKNTQDITKLTDDETLDFAKFLTDTVGVTDDIDGSASILDDQEMQYFKSTVDVSGVTDTVLISIEFKREFSDSFNTTDTDSYLLNKVKNSNSSINDIQTTNFGKLLTETPVIRENLALYVTLAPFINSLSVSELVDVVPNKVILNSTSMTDTGSLRSQGYADFTFFGEDYVGASRNF